MGDLPYPAFGRCIQMEGENASNGVAASAITKYTVRNRGLKTFPTRRTLNRRRRVSYACASE